MYKGYNKAKIDIQRKGIIEINRKGEQREISWKRVLRLDFGRHRDENDSHNYIKVILKPSIDYDVIDIDEKEKAEWYDRDTTVYIRCTKELIEDLSQYVDVSEIEKSVSLDRIIIVWSIIITVLILGIMVYIKSV